MKTDFKKLFASIAIPLSTGGIAAFISAGAMDSFGSLNMPPLSPPAWLFPVVWTLLYILMGVAFYRVWVSGASDRRKRNAFLLYFAQLFFNFVWTPVFFNLGRYLFAFFWLIALWLLIYVTEKKFETIDRISGLLLVPYLVWVAFAGHLNFGIWLLNR